ncbi:MAG: hypothetical protein ACJ76F_04800 [Bacteroidia bacterium]
MNNSKLSGIFLSLSAAEIRQLEKFLNSGLVYTYTEQLTLFHKLKEKHTEPSGWNKEKIYEECFLNKKYDDKKMRYLVTDLTRNIEKFLVYLSSQNNSYLFNSQLAAELSKRKSEKAYRILYNQFRQESENTVVKDGDYYYYLFLNEHINLTAEIEKERRGEGTNIERVLDNLDKFYLAKKLQLCCEVYNVKNVMAINYKAFLLEEITSYLSKNSYDDSPIIQVYYKILMTLTQSDREEHFNDLRDLLLKHENVFGKNDLREMYQYVLNYCIKKINLGNIGFQRTLFEIYKIILENKVLLPDDRISQWDYKNIVTISMRLNEFDWTNEFIHQYKKFLNSEERENAFSYNLAYLYFNRKDYSKTLNLLQKVEFTDLYYQLDSRVIVLKTYYEQNSDEAFYYHVSAFKNFIQRNKLISDYQRTIYTNLIRYASKLVRYSGKRKKTEELKQQVEENRQVADINWLLQKINEELI